MEKPLIRKKIIKHLDAVYEFDNIHYFYWKIEAGFGKSKIGKFRVCLPFIKTDDYEPIKIIEKGKNKTIITRFHYDILIYFNDPVLIEGKPVVEFFMGSHSPILHTVKDKGFEFMTHGAYQGTDSRLIDKFTCLVSFYSVILKSILKKNFRKEEFSDDYSTIIQEPEEEFLFIPKKCKFLICLGKLPEKQELQSVGYHNFIE